MSQDDRTAEKLTPEERRAHLRAFADRMLLKVSAMDDPEDMPGAEKAVRVVAVIERIYYRCDRAERQTPDPRKLEAERATHQSAAIKARVDLADMLEWGEQRRQQQGKWWDAVQDATHAAAQPAASAVTPAVAPQPTSQAAPQAATETPAETHATQGADLKERLSPLSDKKSIVPEETFEVIDYTDLIGKWRVEMGLPEFCDDEMEDWPQRPPPPS